MPVPRFADPEFVAVEGPNGIVILVPASQLGLPPNQPKPAIRKRSNADKDATLSRQLKTLANICGSLSDWAKSKKPYTALLEDCQSLAAQPDVAEGVRVYLEGQPAVRSAAEMLITAIAMSANADWRQAPEVLRGTAARGWFLGRWLPTFLVVDGPISRFVSSEAFRHQRAGAETFRAMRKFLRNDSLFWSVRNAFAHWSFGWEIVDRQSWIVIYDENEGSEKARLHQRQADALHMVSFSIVDALSEVFFRPGLAGAYSNK